MRRLDRQPKDCFRRYAYGVTRRTGRARPWMVKFTRAKRTIYIGSFKHYHEAVLAAAQYLGNEHAQ